MRSAQQPFCDSPTKDAWPEPNQEETSDKPKGRESLQNNWRVFFWSIKITKERLRNCPRLKETKGNVWFWTGSFAIKDFIKENVKTWLGSENQRIVIYQCEFSDFDGYIVVT